MKTLTADEARIRNILDAGIEFSAMIRVFKKGSKKKFLKKMEKTIYTICRAKSQKCFDEIHTNFCKKLIRNIRRNNNQPVSYGQIAKTLNVVLKVAIYYSHLPVCHKYRGISKFLHAAVDNQMMKMLKRKYSNIYPDCFRNWPNNLTQIRNEQYWQIRCVVEKVRGQLLPVQWEDIYWRICNNKDVHN